MSGRFVIVLPSVVGALAPLIRDWFEPMASRGRSRRRAPSVVVEAVWVTAYGDESSTSLRAE